MKLIGQDLNALAHLVTSVSKNEHLLRRLISDLEAEEATQIQSGAHHSEPPPPPDALPFTHTDHDPDRTPRADGTPDL
jgi:hypothetical protein